MTMLTTTGPGSIRSDRSRVRGAERAEPRHRAVPADPGDPAADRGGAGRPRGERGARDQLVRGAVHRHRPRGLCGVPFGISPVARTGSMRTSSSSPTSTRPSRSTLHRTTRSTCGSRWALTIAGRSCSGTSRVPGQRCRDGAHLWAGCLLDRDVGGGPGPGCAPGLDVRSHGRGDPLLHQVRGLLHPPHHLPAIRSDGGRRTDPFRPDTLGAIWCAAVPLRASPSPYGGALASVPLLRTRRRHRWVPNPSARPSPRPESARAAASTGRPTTPPPCPTTASNW